jgi:Type II secretion system (T2SS), protein G
VKRLLLLVSMVSLVPMGSLAGCRKDDGCEKAVGQLGAHLAELRKLKKAPEQDWVEQEAEKRSLAAMSQSCRENQWPDEVLRCVGNASVTAELEKCAEGLSELQRTKLKDAIAKALGISRQFESSKEDRAALTVRKYTSEAFPLWSQAHPDKDCPASLVELQEYMNTNDGKDPWGNPYGMVCGPTLPPGAQGIAITSNGPDGKENTSDDIKSW